VNATPGPAPPGRVLSTLNEDGSRRWIRPRLAPGHWWRLRRATAYILIAVFVALPYLRIAGKPSILLDLPRREFTMFGTTFLATDTLLFMLLFVSLIIALFAFTALFGRVWCGWACPQTVYMEFLFRPIEQWLEGGRIGSMTMDEQRKLHPKRLLKYAIYAVLAFGLAHVFLAYFVGVDRLWVWMHSSPIEHPTSFFVMALTTGAMFLDFAWFREQTCLVACPYGRLQSALLDRRSLIVSYDPRRGEPRMKGKKDRPGDAGDCIDCHLCVIACPTGIDIREGLQMECVHCTQCIDACDSVMAKVGKPLGLIRYSSRDEIEGRPARVLRPRVVLYPLALALALGLLAFNLARRSDADITVLRGGGDDPYTLGEHGEVTNLIRVKVVNRGGAKRDFRVALAGSPDLRLVTPMPTLPVEPGRSGTAMVFVVAPKGAIPAGTRDIQLSVSDGRRFQETVSYRLLGPEPGDSTEHHGREHEGREGDGEHRAPDGAGERR
jgi:cytochrome c oxidase accessory protein FixG